MTSQQGNIAAVTVAFIANAFYRNDWTSLAALSVWLAFVLAVLWRAKATSSELEAKLKEFEDVKATVNKHADHLQKMASVSHLQTAFRK